MKTNLKKIFLTVTLAILGVFIIPQAASAAGSITIQGVVYDKTDKPVPGVTVVAWCGGISFFGGSGVTDSAGHYIIHTNGDDCPFDNELTVTTDINGDSLSDGAAHTQAHTSTVISIHLGSYVSVAVPEYGLVGAGVAVIAGVGVIGFVRRPRLDARQS